MTRPGPATARGGVKVWQVSVSRAGHLEPGPGQSGPIRGKTARTLTNQRPASHASIPGVASIRRGARHGHQQIFVLNILAFPQNSTKSLFKCQGKVLTWYSWYEYLTFKYSSPDPDLSLPCRLVISLTGDDLFLPQLSHVINDAATLDYDLLGPDKKQPPEPGSRVPHSCTLGWNPCCENSLQNMWHYKVSLGVWQFIYLLCRWWSLMVLVTSALINGSQLSNICTLVKSLA